MKKIIVCSFGLILILLSIPIQTALADEFCLDATVGNNNTIILGEDLDFIYTIQLASGQQNFSYLVYIDDKNTYSKTFPGNPPRSTSILTETTQIDYPRIIRGYYAPGEHTIHVIRSPGVGEAECNKFTYTVLEEAPIEQPSFQQYSCTLSSSGKPTNETSFNIYVDVSPAIKGGGISVDLFLKNQKVTTLTDRNTNDNQSLLVYESDPLAPGQYQVKAEVKYSDRGNLITVGSCTNQINICTAADKEKTPLSCGFPAAECLNQSFPKDYLCANFPFCPQCQPSPTITPNPELKKICQNIPDELDNPNDEFSNCEACTSGVLLGQPGAYTALGCLPTDMNTFLKEYLFKFGLGLAGGVAFLLMLWGGFTIVISAGDPQKIQQGREIIVSAVAGLLLIIFSVVILKIIGVDVLQIPGFG